VPFCSFVSRFRTSGPRRFTLLIHFDISDDSNPNLEDKQKKKINFSLLAHFCTIFIFHVLHVFCFLKYNNRLWEINLNRPAIASLQNSYRRSYQVFGTLSIESSLVDQS
jgi:hypothetical protein